MSLTDTGSGSLNGLSRICLGIISVFLSTGFGLEYFLFPTIRIVGLGFVSYSSMVCLILSDRRVRL